MAKGDAKRAQKMIDQVGERQNAQNAQLYQQNYQQYQTPPPTGAVPRPGSGGDTGPPRPRDPNQPTGGQQQPNGGQRMSDADAQQFFDQMFPGETVTPEDLEAHRAELEAAGFTLNPNAGGRITDLTLPSGNTVDPIYGAGGGVNRKQWIVHPGGGGGGGGAFTGQYGNYGSGLLSPALGGYRNFAETGGFSPQDIQNIRARSIAPIRAAYGQGMDELQRQRNVQGGYSPNFGAAMSQMQRQMSNKIGDQALNTEAELAGQIRQGRLAGLGGLGDLGMGINQQGLNAGQMGNQFGLGMVGAQIEKAGVPSNFGTALGYAGDIATVAGNFGRGAMRGSS